MNGKPIWQMVQDCARKLTQAGRVPFTRIDIIECIHEHTPKCDHNSINPMIQGLTDNLKGGAPGAVGKKVLHSVGRGQFVLYSKKDKKIPSAPTTKNMSMSHKSEKASEPNKLTPSTENELRNFILIRVAKLLSNRPDIQLVPEGRLGYKLEGGYTLFHASDILALGNNNKHVSVELKYKSAVTDQFKCRTYDAIHMKKEYGDQLLCIMVFVKSTSGISIQHAERICYPFDHFIGLQVAEIENNSAWEELAEKISTFL